MYYKNVLISSDFLMTKESEQRNNVKWIFDLINQVISTSVNASVESFVGVDSNDESESFSRKVFFDLSGISLFKDEAQFYFDSNEINDESGRYLKKFINNETLVIGYEFSEQTRAILSKNEIPYVDIWLHPIRYMDDVLFAFNSNVDEIKSILKLENLSDSYYKLYASRLKVQSYKGFKRSQFHLKENAALFVGQTLNDKAVLCNGKMLTAVDFKNEFEELAKSHDIVYYSRHPFVKEGDEDVLQFVTSFKNVELIDKPAYELITRDEILTVATISSSVATEAKFFDKKVKYFYQPPVDINIDSIRGYYSVYNKFCSVRFWNSILSPLFESKDNSDINFFDGKDKLRDALSFYWGYRHIDKTESLKMTVGNLFNNRKSSNNEKVKDATDDFLKYMSSSNVEVVSFDIFDTLVCRKTASPRDIFRILEKNLFTEIGFSVPGFAALRIECEDKLRSSILDSTGRQDVTYTEIYSRFMELTGLSESIVNKIKALEFQYELKFIRPRPAGIELFNRALRSNKVVVLTSDMYLEKDQIEEILHKNDIAGYNKLYLSSELGIRKHEGDLFHHVLKDQKISGSSMLHIGDNIAGDIDSAKSFGINTIHIPRAVEIFKKANRRCSNVLIANQKSLNYQQNIVNGLYVNRFYDAINTKQYGKSHFDGSGYELGYIGLGPLIASFCTQIKNTAIQRGIKDIAFLSRDGLIFKRVFDQLFDNVDISTHYVSSSRRSTQVASMTSRVDILNILRKPVYSCRICDYLENRFGLEFDKIKIDSLLAAGLNTKTSMIGGKFDKDLLKQIILDHEELILENAKKEREDYISYIKSFNMSSNFSVVDIGYSGSLQKFFNEFVSKDIFGFYLSTFNTALSNISSEKSFSFISNLHNEHITIHGINTHRFMYENMICSSEDTFVKIDGQDKVYSDENDDKRKSLVDIIHDGIYDFSVDISDLLSINDNGVYFDPFNAEYLLKDFMKYPNDKDAKIFSGIKFQDGFASSVVRYLVPPVQLFSDSNVVNNSIWKEGTSVINKSLTKDIKPKVVTSNSLSKTTSANVKQMSNNSAHKSSIIKDIASKNKVRNAIFYAFNDRAKFKKKINRFISRMK